MRYQLEILLPKPRARVWSAFTNRDTLARWQPALQKIELLSGTAGQPGAVSKLTYQARSREFSLIEKVVHRADPERLDYLYENEFADNTVKNTFLEQGPESTLWKVEVAFKFKTLMMLLFSPFVKKRYVANTRREMERFKEMIENQ